MLVHLRRQAASAWNIGREAGKKGRPCKRRRSKGTQKRVACLMLLRCSPRRPLRVPANAAAVSGRHTGAPGAELPPERTLAAVDGRTGRLAGGAGARVAQGLPPRADGDSRARTGTMQAELLPRRACSQVMHAVITQERCCLVTSDGCALTG